LALSGAAESQAAAGSQAQIPYPQRFCHSVAVHHEHWGVEGGDAVRCHFMRHGTVQFLRDGRSPRHWRCIDAGETGSCHRPHHRGLRFDWYIID